MADEEQKQELTNSESTAPDNKAGKKTKPKKGGFSIKFPKKASGGKKNKSRDERDDRDKEKKTDGKDAPKEGTGKKPPKKMLLLIIIGAAVIIIAAAGFFVLKPKLASKKNIAEQADSSKVALADTFKTDSLLTDTSSYSLSNADTNKLNADSILAQDETTQNSNSSQLDVAIKQAEDKTILEKQLLETKRVNDSIVKESERKLTKTLESMEPEGMSAIMDSLDDNTVIDLLSKMKPKNVSEILSVMNPGRAAKLIRDINSRNK
ncbi:MAG: hypothetical protein WC614_04155 [bacterium]